jgi:hypothetical protein
MTLRPVLLPTLAFAAALVSAGCSNAGRPAPAAQMPSGPRSFIFAWAADADSASSDFLAVIDATPGSASYAQVVASLPTGERGTMAHHTEHEIGVPGELWASGFRTGRTFRFDVRDPLRPRLSGAFGAVGGFSHPHSYVRLPGGNVLATFQLEGAHERHDASHARTGGLVEIDREGRVVRSASAATATDPGIRPYSLAVLPAINRVVTTATDMHGVSRSASVQVWRLSDLRLLRTIQLPRGPRGVEHEMSAEPRLLADGRTVLVSTFTCGLYRLTGLDGAAPAAEWVHASEWSAPPYCAVPVVVGDFWLVPSGPERAIISLDVSDPARPREVGRLRLAADEVPHWLGLDASGRRLLVTGYAALSDRLLLADVDPRTGRVRLDSAFRSPGASKPGVDFATAAWPHGASGRAIPHGAVFSRP